MRPRLHDQLRQLLHRHPAGLRVAHIAQRLGKDESTVRRALQSCWGAYVIAWEECQINKWAALWACVRVPKGATKPTKRVIISSTTEGKS